MTYFYFDHKKDISIIKREREREGGVKDKININVSKLYYFFVFVVNVKKKYAQCNLRTHLNTFKLV